MHARSLKGGTRVMKAIDADVIWTQNTGQVRVEERMSGWARTPGDLWMRAIGLGRHGFAAKEPTLQLLGLFILFNTIVVRDGVPVNAVHQAFLEIDEYRQTISPDAPGASD